MPIRPYPYQHHTITELDASTQRLTLAKLVNDRLVEDSHIHCEYNLIEVIGMLLLMPKVHLVVLEDYPGNYNIQDWIPEYNNQVVEIYTDYEEANTSVDKHNNDDDFAHDCGGYDDYCYAGPGTRAELVPYCLPWKVAIGDILD